MPKYTEVTIKGGVTSVKLFASAKKALEAAKQIGKDTNNDIPGRPQAIAALQMNLAIDRFIASCDGAPAPVPAPAPEVPLPDPTLPL